MAVFKIGSKDSEAIKIQERLKALGHYRGPIDGIFGGGSEWKHQQSGQNQDTQ